MECPEYSLTITINERRVTRVVVDQHYREKHDDLDDRMILELVAQLDGQSFPIEVMRGEFEYFRVEPVFLADKPYRLILLLCASDDFRGVVNAFRIEGRIP